LRSTDSPAAPGRSARFGLLTYRTLAAAPLLVLGTARLAAAQGAGPTPAQPTDLAALTLVAVGLFLAAAGIAALAIAVIYRGSAGPTIAPFGLFALLYGVRIVMTTPLIAPLVGGPSRAANFVVAWITYSLPVFALLYAERIRGRGWLSLLRRSWQAGLVLAIVFVVWDAVTGTPWRSLTVYRSFVIVTMIVLLPHVLFWGQKDPVESTVRTIGTGIFVLTVLHDNLIAFMPWQTPLEVYGLSAFILSLGVVTARRFFEDQRELAAVERELSTGRAIQMAILPRELPSLPGTRIAVRYVPVTSVAGDLYGFVAIDHRWLGVLIADVAGHGVPAALIASMTTVAFNSQRPYAADPGRTLGEINRVLCQYLEARFVTAAYVFIDTEQHTLSYSLAGHPPPLLWKASNRQLIELPIGSTVLGLFPDTTYPTSEVPFEEGDRLVLYTDGLTDVENRAGAWFGDRELRSFVETSIALPPSGFLDALVTHLARWSERTSDMLFDDDLTVVVVDSVPRSAGAAG
jgi:serine phosphatase RsbU (regulator of sigma subunit)